MLAYYTTHYYTTAKRLEGASGQSKFNIQQELENLVRDNAATLEKLRKYESTIAKNIARIIEFKYKRLPNLPDTTPDEISARIYEKLIVRKYNVFIRNDRGNLVNLFSDKTKRYRTVDALKRELHMSFFNYLGISSEITPEYKINYNRQINDLFKVINTHDDKQVVGDMGEARGKINDLRVDIETMDPIDEDNKILLNKITIALNEMDKLIKSFDKSTSNIDEIVEHMKLQHGKLEEMINDRETYNDEQMQEVRDRLEEVTKELEEAKTAKDGIKEKFPDQLSEIRDSLSTLLLHCFS